MEDLLPDVSVKTDVEALEFLKRFEENIIFENDIIGKRYKPNYVENWIQICFKIRDDVLDESWGAFRSDNEKSKRVFLDLRAKNWPEYPLSYELYVGKSLQHFKPLIKMYNQKYSSRRRIHVPSKKSLEPTLTEGAQIALDNFLNAANKQILHLADWNKFYIFVDYCKVNRLNLKDYELKRLLFHSGFMEKDADELAQIYQHIRNFSKRKPV
jgi:hypothetical protein